MISVETAGALVASTATTTRKPQPVRALRPFLVAGERIEIGSIVDVPPQLAAELIAAQKAKPAEHAEPVEAPQPKRKTKKGDDQ